MRCPNVTRRNTDVDQSKKPQARRNNGLDRFLKRLQRSFLKFFMVQFHHPEFRTGGNMRKTLTALLAAYLQLQRCRLRLRLAGLGLGGIGLGLAR
jgi:hypothetical protein